MIKPKYGFVGRLARMCRRRTGAAGLFFVLTLMVSMGGCEMLGSAVQDIMDDVLYGGSRYELADESAFLYLSRDRSGAVETDLESVRAVIAHEAAVAAGGESDASALDGAAVESLYRRIHQARLEINPDQDGPFRRIPPEVLRPGAFSSQDRASGGSGQSKSRCARGIDFWAIDLSRGDILDDYLIPQVDRVPVRNQGGRGTCAAFAGIGSMEYAVLNPNPLVRGDTNPLLATINLSEQFFYWYSKPDCQQSGNSCQEGSWYGDGFDMSLLSPSLDIPLDGDCPYNRGPVSNDTDAPLLHGCLENGVVKVEEMDGYCSLEEAIVDYLNQGYAISYASPLTANWERNEGFISRADRLGRGETVHALGHAYLIVGYRRLPDMPEEGGICFYIKNSWGTGWGVGGYSCMTLAWMQDAMFEFITVWRNPVVTVLSLREDMRAAEVLPPEDPDLENETNLDLPVEDGQPEQGDEETEVLPPPEEPETDPWQGDDGADDDGAPPGPEPPYELPEEQSMAEVSLVGPNESLYRVKAHVVDGAGEVVVKGVLLQDRGLTGALRVRIQGERLVFGGDQVGEYDAASGAMILCTGQFEYLCSLRYRQADNLLYIQFRSDDLRAVRPEEHDPAIGDWHGISVMGRSYQLFVPRDLSPRGFLGNPAVLFRAGVGETPLRLRVGMDGEGSVFSLRMSGIKVGEFDLQHIGSAFLCSGPYRDACRISGGHIVPGNRRPRP